MADKHSETLRSFDTGASGPSAVIRNMLIAVFVLAALIAAYVYLGRTHPLATGQASNVTLFPVHVVNALGSLNSTNIQAIAPVGTETEDQILILAHVRITNVSKEPLTLQDLSGLLIDPDQQLHSSTTNAEDYGRVFLAYPALAKMKAQPLLRGTQIAPQQTVEGEAIFHYPVTREAWDKRKSFSVIADFNRNPSLEMPAQ